MDYSPISPGVKLRGHGVGKTQQQHRVFFVWSFLLNVKYAGSLGPKLCVWWEIG